MYVPAIIVGVLFAGGVLCAVIDLFAPGLIYVLLDTLLTPVRRENIHLNNQVCENKNCYGGLIPDGLNGEGIEKYKICPDCDKTAGYEIDKSYDEYLEAIAKIKLNKTNPKKTKPIGTIQTAWEYTEKGKKLMKQKSK